MNICRLQVLIACGNHDEEPKGKRCTLRECGVGLSRAGKFKGIYGVNESTIRYKRKNYSKIWEASRPVRHLISFWENHCPETVNNFQGAGSLTRRTKQGNMQGGVKGRGRTSCVPQSSRGKSPIMGRFPNLGKCIISYKEVLRSVL